jgi:hypothetical protein
MAADSLPARCYRIFERLVDRPVDSPPLSIMGWPQEDIDAVVVLISRKMARGVLTTCGTAYVPAGVEVVVRGPNSEPIVVPPPTFDAVEITGTGIAALAEHRLSLEQARSAAADKASAPAAAAKAGPTDKLAQETAKQGKQLSKAKLADAAAIAWFKAHPESEPTAKEIADTLAGQITDGDARNCDTWKLHQRGKKSAPTSAGDAAELGEIDTDLEELAGTQQRGRDTRKIRRR